MDNCKYICLPYLITLQPTQRVEAVPWCVNSGERLRFNNLFKQTDTDGDGFVSGVEIKNVFLQTGLPQNILAHIWWVPKVLLLWLKIEKIIHALHWFILVFLFT